MRTVLSTLACAGLPLFPEADLQDVDAAAVAADGYTVPPSATHVYLRDRGTMDVRSTWFRYELPPDELQALREELEADPTVVAVGEWRVPASWPDFGSLDLDVPGWWEPQGETWRRQIPNDGAGMALGRQWALADDGLVHVWMWSLEGWTLADVEEP